jgi:hypothetical protein
MDISLMMFPKRPVTPGKGVREDNNNGYNDSHNPDQPPPKRNMSKGIKKFHFKLRLSAPIRRLGARAPGGKGLKSYQLFKPPPPVKRLPVYPIVHKFPTRSSPGIPRYTLHNETA